MKCGIRIELCREDGSLLRPIVLDECKGGPHEFRGVYRGGLLRTLCSGVPAERIHYSCAVESLRQDEGGLRHTTSLVPYVYHNKRVFAYMLGSTQPPSGSAVHTCGVELPTKQIIASCCT